MVVNEYIDYRERWELVDEIILDDVAEHSAMLVVDDEVLREAECEIQHSIAGNAVVSNLLDGDEND